MAEEAIGPRIARLESHAAYALSKASDLQLDVRELRDEIRGLREQVRNEVASLRAEIHMLRK